MLDDDPMAQTGGAGRPRASAEGPTELERLKAEIEEQQARNQLAALRRQRVTDRLGLLAADAADAPAGTLTLGEGAGAVAPWLAGRVWSVGASDIARAAGAALTPAPGEEPDQPPRVLVVADGDVLARDVVYREVLVRVGRCQAAVASAGAIIADVLAGLGSDDVGTDDGRLRAVAADGETAAGEEAAGEEAAGEEAAGEDEGAGATEAAAPTSLVGTAVDLLKLLRTDYAVTATPVALGDAALADVVAGRLAAEGVEVVREGFAVTPTTSALLTDVEVILEAVLAARRSLAALDRRLAATRSRVELLTDRLGKVQTAWVEALEEAPDGDGTAALEAAVVELTDLVAATAEPIAPAETAATYARDLLTGVETTCLELLTPSAAGDEAPLRTALTHEGIRRAGGEPARITHLLHAAVLGTHADTITRQSLLGSDGRLHHVATATFAWLLHDTVAGRLVGGGTVSPASQYVFDTNRVSDSLTMWNLGDRSRPPRYTAEWALKVAIVALAVMFGVAAVLLGLGTLV